MDARARGQNTRIGPADLAKFYGGLEELRDCGKKLPESYRSGVRFLLTMTPDEVDDLYALGTELPLEPGPSWLSDC